MATNPQPEAHAAGASRAYTEYYGYVYDKTPSFSDFFDVRRISVPRPIMVFDRIFYNATHFASNYALIIGFFWAVFWVLHFHMSSLFALSIPMTVFLLYMRTGHVVLFDILPPWIVYLASYAHIVMTFFFFVYDVLLISFKYSSIFCLVHALYYTPVPPPEQPIPTETEYETDVNLQHPAMKSLM